ncbi:MAG: phosphatidylglycerophosphatase A [Chloroflexi bacterium]|nr:phosphatidylglycerophosphatase A [Chloroflexota bacterium]
MPKPQSICRNRGSNRSRSQSPKKFNDITVKKRNNPGTIDIAASPKYDENADSKPTQLPTAMPQRILNLISVTIATGLGVAYLTPFAKATLASAVTIVIFAALTWGEPAISPWLIAAIIVIFLVGVAASARVKTEEAPDPSRVVIDEVAGQLAAVVILTDVNLWSTVAAFLLFRLFDITKPLGIRRLEAIPNGWGIMLDDLAAGILAALVINVAVLIVAAVV